MPRHVIVFVKSPGRRAHSVARRNLVVSFITGLLLALSTSGGILCERLARGDPNVVVAVGCAMAFTAWVLFLHTRHALSLEFSSSAARYRWSGSLFSSEERPFERTYRLRNDSVVVAQALGAFAGASIVYVATRFGPLAEIRWLSSRPALLVNDLIAVVAIIGLVWAIAMNLNTAIFAAVIASLTLFEVTAQRWRAIGGPAPFTMTVQHALVVQFGLIALGLLVSSSSVDQNRLG
jgi:hypothetical protein